MSVEMQLEDATAESRRQQANTCSLLQSDHSSGVRNDSNAMSSGFLQTQSLTEPDEKAEEFAVSSQARDWFKGLTSEERSGAIAFTDGAFLGTFLAFAAPWSTTATNGGANPRYFGKYLGLRGVYVVLRVSKYSRKLNRKIPE
jgi:hypothetical protein